MEKEYNFEVSIISHVSIQAKSEKQAREMLKGSFEEENNISLDDSEISLLQVVSEKLNKDGTKNVVIE